MFLQATCRLFGDLWVFFSEETHGISARKKTSPDPMFWHQTCFFFSVEVWGKSSEAGRFTATIATTCFSARTRDEVEDVYPLLVMTFTGLAMGLSHGPNRNRWFTYSYKMVDHFHGELAMSKHVITRWWSVTWSVSMSNGFKDIQSNMATNTRFTMSSLLFLPKPVANDGTLETVAIDVEVSFDFYICLLCFPYHSWCFKRVSRLQSVFWF